jgi:hypothetical protein
MPKFSLTAKEIVEPIISSVDLVKNGAIRVPFRIVKSGKAKETPMLDLGKLGTMLMKSDESQPPAAPAVTSVFFSKAYSADEAKLFLDAIGLSAENLEETEDALIYKQADGPQEGDIIYKMDDNVSITVSNLTKMFSDYDWESEEFGAVLKTEKFFPSLRMATDSLRTVVANIMYKAEDVGTAREKVAKAANDFSGYVTGLVESLPVESFKAEEELTKGDYAKKTKGKAKSAMTDEEKEKAKADAKSDDTKPDAKPVAKTEVDAPGVTDDNKSAEGDDDSKSDNALDEFKASVTDALGAIAKSVSDVAATVSDLKKTQDANATEMEGFKATLTKADKKLGGTLVGGGTAPDDKSVDSKSAAVRLPPLLDTALMSTEDRKSFFNAI